MSVVEKEEGPTLQQILIFSLTLLLSIIAGYLGNLELAREMLTVDEGPTFDSFKTWGVCLGVLWGILLGFVGAFKAKLIKVPLLAWTIPVGLGVLSGLLTLSVTIVAETVSLIGAH